MNIKRRKFETYKQTYFFVSICIVGQGNLIGLPLICAGDSILSAQTALENCTHYYSHMVAMYEFCSFLGRCNNWIIGLFSINYIIYLFIDSTIVIVFTFNLISNFVLFSVSNECSLVANFINRLPRFKLWIKHQASLFLCGSGSASKLVWCGWVTIYMTRSPFEHHWLNNTGFLFTLASYILRFSLSCHGMSMWCGGIKIML